MNNRRDFIKSIACVAALSAVPCSVSAMSSTNWRDNMYDEVCGVLGKKTSEVVERNEYGDRFISRKEMKDAVSCVVQKYLDEGYVASFNLGAGEYMNEDSDYFGRTGFSLTYTANDGKTKTMIWMCPDAHTYFE